MRIDSKEKIVGLYKIVLCKEAESNYIEKGYRTCFVEDCHLRFEPDDVSIEIREKKGFFDSLSDGDVIDVLTNGVIRKAFEQKAGDNTLYITDKCNSNCIMCPMPENVRRNGSNIRIDYLLSLIRYIPATLPHVTITGGEPFMIREKLFDILGYLKEKCVGTEFLLLTNGRAFSIAGYAERLVNTAPSRFCVGIPIHGNNARLHDSITRVNGSFEQTVDGIKKLIKGNVDVEIRIVVTRFNADSFTDIARMIIKEYPNISSVKIMAMEMLGNAATHFNQVWIPYDEIFGKIKSAINLLVNNNIDVAIYNMPLCFVDEGYWYICKKSISDYKIRYYDKCLDCNVKNLCGGVFAGTYRFLEDSVKPCIK